MSVYTGNEGKENKIVFSLSIWRKLVERGNIPTSIIPNPTNPRYNCWVFPMTDKLQKDLDEIFEERKLYGRR